MLRSEFLIDAIGVNKIAGQPFKVAEIENAIDSALENL
jgi:2-oxoglutarate ferredoxin oxidoreductase subunit alpha